MSAESKEKDCNEWQLVQPIPPSHRMTTWKSGQKFQPEAVYGSTTAVPTTGTPSRLRKVGTHVRKGNFQKKNKVADAPTLLSVVTATPEMKERAKAEAKARQIKIEEYRKYKNSRTIVKKQPLKQPKSQWQNMITKSNHSNKSMSSPAASKKKKSKSTGGIAIADWKAAYQDILSPNSGNRKYVARRDLAAAEKVFSPKKKVRGKARSASATLFSQTLPLVSTSGVAEPKDVTYDSGKSEEASVMSKASIKKTPLSIDLSVEDEKSARSTNSAAHPEKNGGFSNGEKKLSVLVSPISEKDEQELEMDTNDMGDRLTKAKSVGMPFSPLKANDDTADNEEDGFVDFDDFDEPSETMDAGEQIGEQKGSGELLESPPCTEEKTDLDSNEKPMELSNSIHIEKIPLVKHSGTSTHAKETPRKSKKLILEFSMPALTGDPQTGDDDDVGLEVPVDVYSYGDISSVGSWPSIESEDSYETRMNKMMQRWMDVDGGDENNFQCNNDVQLDDNVLDHIVLAAPDLEQAMEQFHEMTGIMPTHVGPLQGLGAKTAHVGLDNNRYIEIIAPDNDDPGPLGEELKCLEEGILTPYHYAIRSSEVSRLIEGYVYDVLGWDPDHIAMVQALPDDTVRQWDLLTMYGHDMGGVAPYYVRWLDPTHHPTAKIPLCAKLLCCRVIAPKDHDVHKLITGVGGIDIETGDPTLECVIESPNGIVTFSAKQPKGLVFPGYEEEYA